MISDTEYEAWLNSDAERVVLVEIDYWDGDSVETLYLSDKGYNTNLSAGVEHRVYIDAVNKVPSLKQSLDNSRTGFGEIVIANPNGIRDSWFTDYAFDGRKVVQKHGSPAWEYADFRQLSVDVIASRSAKNAREIVLKLRSPEAYLEQPIQTALMASGPNTGDYKPVAYGEINNATAVLLDAATHKYQISDIEIDSIQAVKDNYKAVASYTPQLADGTFTLGSAPSGTVTVSFKGADVSAVLLEKAGEIIDHIITTRTSLPAEFYDADAFTDLDSDITWKHNLYITERMTARQAITKILDSIGAKLIRNREGKISVARHPSVAVSAVLELGVDHIQKWSFKPVKVIAPWQQARLGYAKNYTVMESLDTTISQTDRAAAQRSFDIVSDTNAVLTEHPLAEEPELIETTLTDQADATARLTELMTQFGQERFIHELVAYQAIFQVTVGQTIELTHDRFGFSAGKNAVVWSQDDDPTRGKSRVQLWH
ncbi:MAG: hypothetical protein DHS20C12_12000 [Pseudohongiella sp.]|nr:MAG: hypothetical protein DHS20C12_12000 [Pseudohongiella sp.]